MGQFLSILEEELIAKWSKQRDPQYENNTPFAQEPTLKLDIWTVFFSRLKY